MQPVSQPETITTAAVAELIGESRSTVKRYAACGLIPTVTKLDGRTGPYLFDRAAVEAWATARRQAAALKAFTDAYNATMAEGAA